MMKVIALLFFVGLAASERVHFHGDKVLRVIPKDETQVEFLRDLQREHNVDFWTEVRHPGVASDIRVEKSSLEEIETKLMTYGLSYTILINDLEKEVVREEEELKRNSFSNGFNYYTYNRLGPIHEEMKRMQAKHSSKASLFSVGKSYEGRNMLAMKISSGGVKPAIWIDGCIHAREWISCASVMFFLKQMLEPDAKYADRITTVLSKYDFYILPVFNVDGYEFTHTDNRMWRKTRSKGRRCVGADPNRNWDSHFGGAGTTGFECSDIYHGKHAFSEIEVKQVADKLMNLKKNGGLKSYWNMHAYSQLVLHPWSYTKKPAPDDAEISRIAHVFADGIKQSSGKIFQPGQPSHILYAVAGGSMDWTYEKLGVIYSYAPEMRPKEGELDNGFLISPIYIRPSGNEFTNGMLNAVLAMK